MDGLPTIEDIRAFWDRVAADWEIQVGEEGDANRILNSDPVLWDFAGDVAGRDVLDAGCGTGYLARKLAQRGARVVGIDLSEKMIELARRKAPDLAFHMDSVSELRTLGDGRFDLVVANYVLMDTPDLPGAMRAFHRVLKPRGIAVLVFSHPCFPQGRRTEAPGGGNAYVWDFPYFEPRACTDPPWAHFTSEFIWFHRPLSDYWKAFDAAGFSVTRFEEPRTTPQRHHLARSERDLKDGASRPYSVAFRLSKRSRS